MEIQFIPIFCHISKEGFLNFFVWWGLYILVCPTVRSGCCSKFKFYSNWSFGPCKSSFVIIAIFQVQVESALTRAGEKAQIILMMMIFMLMIMMLWLEVNSMHWTQSCCYIVNNLLQKIRPADWQQPNQTWIMRTSTAKTALIIALSTSSQWSRIEIF